MRILMVIGAYAPAIVHGGTVYTSHSLSKGLIELGHEVLVLTTDRCGSKRLPVPRGETVYDGVPVHYCRWVKSPIPYHSPELVREVGRQAHEFDVALINTNWTGYGVGSAKACLRVGLPYIVYSHGGFSPTHLRKGWVKKMLWWWLLDSSVYNRAAAVVALNQAGVDQVLKMGIRARVEIVPNGVDSASLALAASRAELCERFPALEGRRWVLFLGRLESIKGLDLLIPAFAQVVSEFPDTLLVIAGPSERGYESFVVDAIHKHGLDRSACLTGMVTGLTKGGLLHDAEVFVLPSYGEGMPITALEAMACGTPVIVSRASNLPEVDQESAGLVVDTNVDEIAKAIREILAADDQLRRQMGSNGQKLVQDRFTWQSVSKQTIALCESVLAQGHSVKCDVRQT
jgi:glycosyltransferase involved in cell wall biosynthesis